MRLKTIFLMLTVLLLPWAMRAETVTIASLADDPYSSVELVSNHFYRLKHDLRINTDDILVIENGDTVAFPAGIFIDVYGSININPADKAVLTACGDNEIPGGVRLMADGAAAIRNAVFLNVAIENVSTKGMTVENCRFEGTQGKPCIKLSKVSDGNVVRGCQFLNAQRPAIQNRSRVDILTGEMNHVYNGVLFENNVVTNCNTSNQSGFAMVDLASGVDYTVTVRGNKVSGTRINGPGGIDISHIVYAQGAHKVYVTDNEVRDCSNGIRAQGPMDIELSGNILTDNRWSKITVFHHRGAGIILINESLHANGSAVCQKNTIKGCLRGIVVAMGFNANLGTVNGEYVTGGFNRFSDNGTWESDTALSEPGISWDPQGHPCDLYVYATVEGKPLYAQKNNWANATTDDEVAYRIQSNYVDVVYTPFDTSGVEGVQTDSDAPAQYFGLDGTVFGTSVPTSGVYIMRKNGKTSKVFINKNK